MAFLLAFPRMALAAVQSTLALVIAIGIWAGDASASHVVHLPISAALRADTGSGFNIIVMSWDQEGAPNPLRLQWSHSQVPVRGAGLSPLAGAFDYAVSRLGPQARPTGTLSLSTLSQVPTSSEGVSSGAALAVGFLAVLKGERLINGIALTGTLESTGRIGSVARIADKIKAAAHSGYRVLLVPRGQLPPPRVNLVRMGADSRLVLREVGTVDEAYEIMTGKKL